MTENTQKALGLYCGGEIKIDLVLQPQLRFRESPHHAGVPFFVTRGGLWGNELIASTRDCPIHKTIPP